MHLLIRPETQADHSQVFSLVQAAFAQAEHSDHKEQFLVDRLRKSDAYIPELSMVAEGKNGLLGHILLTRIEIREGDHTWPSLALAPVSVLPDWQGQGIGSQLIQRAHEAARKGGHSSIILLGHPAYYPRFGYRPLGDFWIHMPFEAPAEACMALELIPGALQGVSGQVVYPPAFGL